MGMSRPRTLVTYPTNLGRLHARSLSSSHRRQLLSVLPKQPGEFQTAGQSWCKSPRLRKQSPKPAEKDAIRPVGNCDLIACEEPERRADAMDCWPIRQMFAQIMTEFFLCAAANRNDHVSRATTLDQREKIWIGDFDFITRRDMTILGGNR